MQSLQSLDLSSNQLNGSFPDIGDSGMTSLTTLNVSHNLLSGALPSTLNTTLAAHLTTCDLFPQDTSQQGFYCPTRAMDACFVAGVCILPSAQSQALLDLQNALSLYPTVWTSTPPDCTSSGVTCDVQQRVTSVLLPALGLTGTIPSTIGLLGATLTSLNLGTDVHQVGNSISGGIPSSIGDLTGLTYLNLAGNQLSGPIPSTVSQLTQLQYLNLADNQHLNGTIPAGITQLTQLQYLALSNNQLSGSIPSDIGDALTQLTYLTLGTNQLSGSIPTSIASLTGLVILDLSVNKLSGWIPSPLPPSWSTMVGCTIAPQLTDSEGFYCVGPSAPVPPVCDAAYLCTVPPDQAVAVIDLRDGLDTVSEWTGTEPNCRTWAPALRCNSLGRVVSIDLAGRSLAGSIPSTIGLLNSTLVSLNMSANGLTGSLPSSLGSLTSLAYLRLGSNNLAGPLPSGITGLVDLVTLELGDNQLLSGTLPSDLGSLSSLRTLDLSDNQFSGTLPSSITDLTDLTLLDISSNSLSGPIPAGIGSLSSLQTLDASHNRLNGTAPLGGIEDLTALSSLSLAYNDLAGEPPPTFGSTRLRSPSWTCLTTNSPARSRPPSLPCRACSPSTSPATSSTAASRTSVIQA